MKSPFDRRYDWVKNMFCATIEMVIKQLLVNITKFRETHSHLMCLISCLK